MKRYDQYYAIKNLKATEISLSLSWYVLDETRHLHTVVSAYCFKVESLLLIWRYFLLLWNRYILNDFNCEFCKHCLITVCPYIPMCAFRNCTGVDDNFCQFCMYENAPEKYQRAYKYDEGKNACISKYSNDSVTNHILKMILEWIEI